MIQLIFGEKGSGKTKKILELANRAAETAKGSIVFVDIDDDYMYDLNLSIRFINATEYALSGPKMFYGFLCGIAASDHDLEYLVIDSFMKIVRHDLDTLEDLFRQMKRFSDNHNVHLVLSLSCMPEQLPEFLKPYLE
ncbi:MAG: twitching motility protein PilT [Clostridia bacterium]|nr:twitching motility protein PilT [Clostridia bacterium]MBR0436701.1 twitching motility protein PilT [Clostridia bacterium]MBR2645523.1 twitching motility protein PilT [Clostridia bacterium]